MVPEAGGHQGGQSQWAAQPVLLANWWLAYVLAHYTQTHGRTCPCLGSPVTLILRPQSKKVGTGVAEEKVFWGLREPSLILKLFPKRDAFPTNQS